MIFFLWHKSVPKGDVPMSIETGELLYDALKNLVFAVKIVRKKFFDNVKFMGFKSWFKEFCTIKLGCARRTGHDYCISRFVEDNKNSNFVIFSPNHIISELLKDEIGRKIGFIPENVKFFHRHSDSFVGIKSPNYVIMNCAWALSQKDVDAIYSNFYDPRTIFILIQ